jgi:hypothetical protein
MSGEMMPRRTVSTALIKICWNECGTRRVAGVSPLSGLRLLWPHRRDCAHDHFCSLAHGTVGRCLLSRSQVLPARLLVQAVPRDTDARELRGQLS